MTKLKKKPSEVVLISPPTHKKIIVEINHKHSITLTEVQAKALADRDLATKRTEKLVKNTYQPGYHQLVIYRITNYLYNKCTVNKHENHFLIKLYNKFVAPIVEWHYRSCIAILMGRL